MKHKHIEIFFVLIISFLIPLYLPAQKKELDNSAAPLKKIVVSENKRFLQYEDGSPFFWLGDTAWMLFEKLTREEVKLYIKDRKQKGFNVIQCMVISKLPLVNIYGDSAFSLSDPTQPFIKPGNNFNNKNEYDYWDHVDYIINEAEKSGIRVALVTIWGNVVKQNSFSTGQIEKYIKWLVNRYGNYSNIIWMNGGDIKGNIKPEIWKTIGTTLKANDSNHIITFHPFGRTQSSTWFYAETWLDLNMFQSGHRRYDQKKGDGEENWKGEDNWRYVVEDYALNPGKPTLDGEPSYENIPQGLHDTTQPYWKSADCRRYAYWSVMAGACGHTYGDNSIMQFYKPADKKPAYGPRNFWNDALNDSGSGQMKFVPELVLSRPYFERRFDSTLITDQGTRYDFVITAKGASYVFAYTYTGRPFSIRLGVITGKVLDAWWYNPRNGEAIEIGKIKNSGSIQFTPPGKTFPGNDWVLVLDDDSAGFKKPGRNI